MAIHRPSIVQATDTAYKDANLTGPDVVDDGNTYTWDATLAGPGFGPLGDDLDETYVEQWASVRDGVPTSSTTARAFFDPLPGYVWTQFRMRFEVFNDTGGTGTDYFVFVLSIETGFEIGYFARVGTDFRITAGAVDTIYDLSDGWTFIPTGAETLDQGLAGGLRVNVRRVATEGEADADYGIRVFQLEFGVEEVRPGIPPLRISQRSDTTGTTRVLGGGNTRQRGLRVGPGAIL